MSELHARSTATRTQRLFFALWPSDQLRRDIELATRDIVRASGGRIIPADNFHITLAFLGSVAEAQIAALFACARETMVLPFELSLGSPHWWEQQKLLCTELASGQEALAELVDRLHSALRAKGFEVERRPFRAHVTLARDVRSQPALKIINELHWQVNRIELVASQTQGHGSIYTVLPLAMPS